MNTPASGETPTNDEVIDPGVTPENPTDPSGEAPEPEQPNEPAKTPEEMAAEIKRLEKALSSANRESAGRRKKLDALEAEEQKRKDAELSESQREKKRADEAEAREREKDEKLKRFAILDAVRGIAGTQRLSLNEAALSDAYAAGVFGTIELDEDGKPQGIDAVFKDLVKSRPYILQQQAVTPPDLNGGRGGKKDELMDDDEFDERARRLGIFVPRRNK